MSNTRRDLLKWLCVPFLVCGLPSGSVSAEGAWTKKADMPTPRAGIHANTVGDLLYVIGGDNLSPRACRAASWKSTTRRRTRGRARPTCQPRGMLRLRSWMERSMPSVDRRT